ncbi:superoxide dismutase family protein [uncultured Sphingomonas sp.]|uniref:superoxide dismutase family protein n=1 Tax=uncultured Sphingomonas sp. TaxID=158754 RepID=UPI0035CBA1D9
MRVAVMRAAVVGAALVLALAGCRSHPQTGSPLAGGAHAVAVLHNAAGIEVGRATASDVAGGMRVTLDAHALPPGTHGAHIHTVGLCDGPDFQTAGGHWNPTGAKHGAMNPQGPHEGDLPNLIVGSDGHGIIGVVVPGASVAALMDADGAAMMIHAGADDLMTDPAGNSGARIACGVFAAR